MASSIAFLFFDVASVSESALAEVDGVLDDLVDLGLADGLADAAVDLLRHSFGGLHEPTLLDLVCRLVDRLRDRLAGATQRFGHAGQFWVLLDQRFQPHGGISLPHFFCCLRVLDSLGGASQLAHVFLRKNK